MISRVSFAAELSTKLVYNSVCQRLWLYILLFYIYVYVCMYIVKKLKQSNFISQKLS